MNNDLRARKLKTEGILLYFGDNEEVIEVGEYIDNLQTKIDKAIELNENIKKALLTCCSYEKDKVEDLLFDQLNILKEDK